MKRVLCIANLVHASPRIPAIMGHLAEEGWCITVITPGLSAEELRFLALPKNFRNQVSIVHTEDPGDVFERWRALFRYLGYDTNRSLSEQVKADIHTSSGRNFIDWLLRAYQTVFAYPDTERQWRGVAIEAAQTCLQERKYDVIVSSSPFPTTHTAAHAIKSMSNIPWVADFRDPWTGNPVYSFPSWRQYLERRLERKTIASADDVITVSHEHAERMQGLHNRTFHIIPNGYTEREPARDVKLTEKFTITYTGTVYQDRQDVEKAFQAVCAAISDDEIERQDVEFRFFGKFSANISEAASLWKIEDLVRQHGVVSRHECWRLQAESQLLLFLNWEDIS